MLEKCPYCATNHSKDLFNCSGSDYFVSVSIRQSKMYLMVFSWNGDYSEDYPKGSISKNKIGRLLADEGLWEE